ncbi:hypothetical protein D3C84_1020410 [compost metagenome]
MLRREATMGLLIMPTGLLLKICERYRAEVTLSVRRTRVTGAANAIRSGASIPRSK